MNATLSARWGEIQARLAPVARRRDDIARTLRSAGVPLGPDELGWSEKFFEDATRHARLIRDRYTFLDLAGDAAESPRM
jgi:glycerol dehydrogenase-like iron-containing ADH family enzyme